MFFLLAQIFPLLLLAAVLGAVLAYWWLKNRQMDVTESYELITERLAAIEARPEPAAREDYEAGMALISSAVRSLRMPDMDPVNQRLAALEASVAGFTVPETDLAPLHGKFDGVDANLSGIASRLTYIEGRMTAQDPRLNALDERLSELGTRVADVDPRFTKLDDRLTALDAAVTSIARAVSELRNTDLQPVEARFGKIEETLSAFKIPEVDLGPLHSGLARLDLTIAGLDRPATDLGPVQGPALAQVRDPPWVGGGGGGKMDPGQWMGRGGGKMDGTQGWVRVGGKMEGTWDGVGGAGEMGKNGGVGLEGGRRWMGPGAGGIYWSDICDICMLAWSNRD